MGLLAMLPIEKSRYFAAGSCSLSRTLVRSLIAFAAVLFPFAVQSQEAQFELRVKAAFIYNFSKYIVWDKSDAAYSDDVLRICVVKDRDFFDLVNETVAAKTSQGRVVEVYLLRDRTEIGKCHMAYVSDERSIYEWRKELLDSRVITVGEGSQFVESGGIFGFLIVDDKIRFEVNLGAAERKGIKISSKLLSLARRVIY